MPDQQSSTPHVRANEKEIIIYHVGGSGNYGLATTIIERIKPHVSVVVFEARDDAGDTERAETTVSEGYRTTVVNRAIDEGIGTADFYVNTFGASSSLLKPSPLAVNEDPGLPYVHTWGQNTELERIIQLETVSLDHLIETGLIPPPDILSIDAQGAEVRIMRGARKALESALCIISEVEFFEIYDGQGLFDDQMRLLGEYGFRMLNILGPQFFHAGPAVGRLQNGFMTAAEAVWLRCVKELPDQKTTGKRGYVPLDQMTDYQLMRLAGIAIVLVTGSYAGEITKYLKARNPGLYQQMLADGDTIYGHAARICQTIEETRHLYRSNRNLYLAQ